MNLVSVTSLSPSGRRFAAESVGWRFFAARTVSLSLLIFISLTEAMTILFSFADSRPACFVFLFFFLQIHALLLFIRRVRAIFF